MNQFAAMIVTFAAATAYANPPEVDRCIQGVAHAKRNDLPRAALYLEGCDQVALADAVAEDVGRASAEVAKRLRASDLSSLSISTTPENMVAETDALPGERFTTPATIYTKAGTYKVSVAFDAAGLASGKAVTSTTTIGARTRGSVIINAGTPKQTAPKDGKVNFEEEADEQTAHKGPPPPIKHVTILPKKYLKPTGPTGPQIDDPFAVRHHDVALKWRLGARFAAGVFDQAGAGVGFAVAALAARPLDGPAMLTTRLDWSHRDLDTIGVNVGFGIKILETNALIVSTGAALRGEVRVQDTLAMEPVARAGIGAAADIDFAVLQLPLAIGLRFEQGFTELVPGARNRAMLLELGYDWR